MTNEAVYEVSTQWGSIRLDEQSYQDYLDGRSWLSSASDVKGTAKTTAAVEECPRDISRQAINLRGEADKAGVWETVQHGFPGMAVQIPYRRRMSDIGIDELNLSVRASNGLMRAGIDTLGKLNEMMKTDRGIAGIRNLGTKSVKEIGRAFLCWETVQHGFPGMAVQIPYRRRMSDIGIDELNLSVRASNGLMRAGIDTLGKLNEMMKTDRGIAGIRNLGTKSVKEIGRAFLCMVYSMLSPYEKAQYWQRLIDKAQTNE